MSHVRPPYAPEFRRQMVELVRAGRCPEELSRELEPSAQRSAIGSCKPIPPTGADPIA